MTAKPLAKLRHRLEPGAFGTFVDAQHAFGEPPQPSIFPFLFITIACVAVSGFHSLVSSGTTSKQLDKETDARHVAYLGSLARRRGRGWLEALGAAIHGSSYAAIIVDDETVSSGDVLEPDEAVQGVRAALGVARR